MGPGRKYVCKCYQIRGVCWKIPKSKENGYLKNPASCLWFIIDKFGSHFLCRYLYLNVNKLKEMGHVCNVRLNGIIPLKKHAFKKYVLTIFFSPT